MAGTNPSLFLVPHEFGRSIPPLIKTIPQLKHEIELLEALDEIEIVFSALNTDGNTRLNPVDQQYEQLKCQLFPVEKDQKIYQIIEQYLQTTHASTHQQYQMQIEEIFEMDKENEKEQFNDVGNKMLLWYRTLFRRMNLHLTFSGMVPVWRTSLVFSVKVYVLHRPKHRS